MVENLFDSSGEWVGFKINKNVFDTDGDWIGWIPWNDSDVVTSDGDYLGTIYQGNRIYHFANKPYRGYPGYPGYPGYLGYPGYPGYAGYSPLPSGARDIIISKKKA